MRIEDWLFPPGTFTVPGEAFVGVHPGAGTSTWSTLLEGVDHGLVIPPEGKVTAVCRTTPAALAGAKALVGAEGAHRFKAFLVVADAPGRMLPAAAREIKILASVTPVIEVPWITKLRGIQHPEDVTQTIMKPVSRVRDQLASAHVRLPRGIVKTEKGK